MPMLDYRPYPLAIDEDLQTPDFIRAGFTELFYDPDGSRLSFGSKE